MLLSVHWLRRTHPRLVVALACTICLAMLLVLIVDAFDRSRTGTFAAWFSSRYVSHADRSPAFWIATLLFAACAAVSGVAHHRSGTTQGRRAAPNAAADRPSAASESSDRLLADPGTITAAFRGEDFGRGERRIEMLALARKLSSSLPEFSKSIFAAALSWYARVPKDALADSLTPADLAQMAAALIALECQHQSEPPERADYHYRTLIGFGKPEDGWWGAVLEAQAGNAGRISDALSAAESMNFVAGHAAPASVARKLALAWLRPFLHACEVPREERDDGTTREINFLASLSSSAAQDDEIALLANTVFWERGRRCRALDDTQQYASLMLAGMSSGSAALGHQAMAALCSEFPKLAATSVKEAAAVVDALYRQRRNGRGPLPLACLAQVEPILAAIDPAALDRVRQAAANRESEWWM
ncbi:MAG: hypothetical protein WKG03_04480 [Telluria sp.]